MTAPGPKQRKSTSSNKCPSFPCFQQVLCPELPPREGTRVEGERMCEPTREPTKAQNS